MSIREKKHGKNSDEITLGADRAGQRCLLYSLGVTREDIRKPFIAVVNSWNEILPGGAPLREVAESVKKGVLAAGGLPFEFCTVGVCDGIAQGHEGMKYSLPSRNIIADSIEIMLRGHCFDGAVFIGSCDKITPGMLMAAMRVDIPSIFVCSGPMIAGRYGDETLTISSMREYTGTYHVGRISHEEFTRLEELICPSLGSCSLLGTANSMACIVEALGLSFPYTATVPPFFAEKQREARRAGARIVKLVEEDVRPREIVDKDSFENALKVAFSIGSSTNVVLHMSEIAEEAGIPFSLEAFDRISRETPYIAKIRPSGRATMDEFREAGGTPAVMRSLGNLLNLDRPTVTGMTIGEILKDAPWLDREVIRPRNDPFSGEGGLKVLWGNIAPGGAIVKRAAVAPHMRQHSGPARVFEGMEDAIKALKADEIESGSVLVIRYEGQLGGPGMREMHMITSIMVGTGLSDTTALITDGRFSGSTRGPCIGHIMPEAAEGGPISLLEDGDTIKIDIDLGRLDVELTDDELVARKRAFVRSKSPDPAGVLKTFTNQVRERRARDEILY